MISQLAGRLHFIPTSSPWLNLVDRWFRDLTERRVRREVFRNVPALIEAIQDYIDHHNDTDGGFVWTAESAHMLANVRRAGAVFDQTPSD